MSSHLIDSFKRDVPAFSFSIKQQVEVTESYIPEFSVSAFLAELGGSLGLWLGVGAVQLLSIGIGLLKWI